MNEAKELRALGQETFDRIRRGFPHLAMNVDPNHADVDILIDIPAQPGLTFPVTLNLQTDELHLSAGSFWLEWFPCTKAEIRDANVEAVSGLLSGEFRIRELYSGRRPVRAELQRLHHGAWRTIGTHSRGFALPWARSIRILQNAPRD